MLDYIYEKIDNLDDGFTIALVLVLVIALAVALAYFKSYILMLIWNKVIAGLFDISAITIGKAFGLYVLCSICFKSNVTTKKD